jgi:hypothetical protein
VHCGQIVRSTLTDGDPGTAARPRIFDATQEAVLCLFAEQYMGADGNLAHTVLLTLGDKQALLHVLGIYRGCMAADAIALLRTMLNGLVGVEDGVRTPDHRNRTGRRACTKCSAVASIRRAGSTASL